MRNRKKPFVSIGAGIACCILAIMMPCMFFGVAHIWAIPSAHAAEVTLAWDANTESDLAGYKVYHGLPGMDYADFVVTDVGDTTTCTIADLAAGQTYRFVATAYDDYGSEGDFSAEVLHDPPPGPVQNLIIEAQDLALQLTEKLNQLALLSQ